MRSSDELPVRSYCCATLALAGVAVWTAAISRASPPPSRHATRRRRHPSTPPSVQAALLHARTRSEDAGTQAQKRRQMLAPVLAAAALLSCHAARATGAPRDTVLLLNVTSAGFAKVLAPTCPDGKTLARDILMWNVMYEPNKDGTNRGNDLSKMASTSTGMLLCVYPTYWKNWSTDLGHRGWPTSVSAIWPSLAGPWCDKKADPSCKPEYIKNNGGCPQAVDMDLHKAALRAGLDAQVPVDFEGYVSYDMEGWMGNEGNTSGYAQACGGADAFHAAARKCLLPPSMLCVSSHSVKKIWTHLRIAGNSNRDSEFLARIAE